MGAVDSISEETLFEFKFSPSGTSNIHRLQAVLYSYALNQNTNVEYITKVINLCTGEVESLTYNFVLSDDLFEAFFKVTLGEMEEDAKDAVVTTFDKFAIVQFYVRDGTVAGGSSTPPVPIQSLHAKSAKSPCKVCMQSLHAKSLPHSLSAPLRSSKRPEGPRILGRRIWV